MNRLGQPPHCLLRQKINSEIPLIWAGMEDCGGYYLPRSVRVDGLRESLWVYQHYLIRTYQPVEDE